MTFLPLRNLKSKFSKYLHLAGRLNLLKAGWKSLNLNNHTFFPLLQIFFGSLLISR